MNESLQKALQKAKQYCAYQERCHSEVREKLYSFDLRKKEVEILLTQLIEENYLNEERFAIAYAGGKFRMKKWGREKIKQALKQKQVSDYCIRKAVALLSDDDYNKTFTTIATKKLQSLSSEKNIFTRKRKLRDHLLQKGYEHALIGEWIKNI